MGFFGGGGGGPYFLHQCVCSHWSHYHHRHISLPPDPPEHFTEFEKKLYAIDKKIGACKEIHACEVCKCSSFQANGNFIQT